MNQLAMNFEARVQRDAGIEQAVTHAGQVDPDWAARAYAFLLVYINKCRMTGANTLTSEDVRAYAHGLGLPVPPSSRAWGGPMLRARRAGLLVRHGITEARDPGCHMGIRNVWRIA